MTRYVALIPARGGSRGIPRKNLAPLRGKPLLSYTILAARECRYISEVYLSSDDDEILRYGSENGCLPVRRPRQYAQDTSGAVDVVTHFLTQVEGGLREKDSDIVVVYLQPTSPLRTSDHLDEAIESIATAGLSVVSVVELEKSPYKSFVISEEGRLKSLFEEEFSNQNRQSLPVTYIPNGAIYAFRARDFIQRGGFPSNGSLPYIMSADDSVDIDSESDLRVAAEILERNGG